MTKFKVICGDNEEIDFLLPNEIKNIVPIKDKDGNEHLFVSYEDPEFCIVTSLICERLEVINE